MGKALFRSVLITGGSSGIGLAIAKELAGPDVYLTITGRDEQRLNQTETELSQMGVKVMTYVCDVTDSDEMENLIKKADEYRPLDLVIANAGISSGSDFSANDHEKARNIMHTNVIGVMNTVQPAIDRMTARKSGHIAIVSSLAGLRGLPTAPTYSASKAAVKAWGDAIRPHLKADGVGLSIIYPGFVRSRITDQNDFPMPFFMDAERAARIIVEGLDNGKLSIAFPWQMVLIMKFMSALPAVIFDQIMAKGPKKL